MIFKKFSMKTMYQLSVLAIVIMFMAACGGTSATENKGELSDKKAELQKLKDEQVKLSDKIQKLEAEIFKIDSSAVPVKQKLVAVTPLATQNFTHYIDLQGKITTENIYYIAPRGGGGIVKEIYVKEGDRVSKGQLIMKLDDAVMQQNLKQLETQLSFAKNIYERQKNLWDQGIGTEVQFLTAKNNVDNVEKQISVMKEQWNTSNVYSEVPGVVETVSIRVGENFVGSPTAGITIVNPGKLKAEVVIPENYLSKIKKGTPVIVEVSEINKKYNSTISFISELINSSSRGFTAEAKIPGEPGLKPNQLALVRIQDYTVSNVIVIPMNTIQTDEKGKYVYVMAEENGKTIASKRPVIAGEIYGEQIEIRKGLSNGDRLIIQGFQDLYEGQAILQK